MDRTNSPKVIAESPTIRKTAKGILFCMHNIINPTKSVKKNLVFLLQICKKLLNDYQELYVFKTVKPLIM